ncbi:MAG: sigma-70 family RNA polymerase sigma factor [Cyclobacteriaceae bacterium]
MEAVKNGKLDQLNILFERYSRRVYNYFLKSTLDRDGSNDLTQDVFTRILKYRRSYRLESRFETWMFQIARNLIKDHFTKMKVYRDHFDWTDELPDQADETNEDGEKERRLYRALEKLPVEKRELLVMSKFQKMKYEQIATIREVSVGAIKVQVHRAIAELRNIYFEENGE